MLLTARMVQSFVPAHYNEDTERAAYGCKMGREITVTKGSVCYLEKKHVLFASRLES
jgi:hypothetical protein